MITDVDVLIVGGGWTGVSAALRLHEHNTENPDSAVTFALLEGHPSRLGGRAFSYGYQWKDATGAVHETAFEHGAQYVGQSQTALWALIQQAIAQGVLSPDDLVDGYQARLPYKEQVMMIAGKRYPYDRDQALFGIGGVPPELGLWDVMGVLVIVGLIQAVEQSINVLSPWESPAWVTELDQVTLLAWLDSLNLPPGARSLLRVSVEAVISVEADQVSAFYFFWYCACNGGFLNEVNDEQGGPQQFYLASGLDGLVEKLAAPISKQIVREQIVKKVDYAGDGSVTVTTAGEHTYRAKKVIVATSPASANKLEFSPDLPPAWKKITSQSMGTTVKCQVFYKSPWWRNVAAQADPSKEGVPQYTGYCGANDYPVIWVMDYSPVGPAPKYEDQGCYALMTFTIGSEAKELLRNPTQERIVEWVTKALCDLFNDTRALSTSSEYLDLKWFSWDATTPLIPGGPNTVFSPGVLTGADAPARAFDTPIDGKVYFAAAELACKSPSERQSPAASFVPDWKTLGQTGTYSDYRQSLGYMDGAVTCGRFVAEQVLVDLSLSPAAMKKSATKGAGYATATNGATAPPSGAPMPRTPAAEAAPIPEATICTALTMLCQRLYAASAPPGSATTAATDPVDLQAWLAGVLIEILVANGLLTPPPAAPPAGFNEVQAIAYMLEMALWQPGFVAASLSFIQSGYALDSASPPGPTNQVNQLATIASTLMRLKSVEPAASGGRLAAIGGALQAAVSRAE